MKNLLDSNEIETTVISSWIEEAIIIGHCPPQTAEPSSNCCLLFCVSHHHYYVSLIALKLDFWGTDVSVGAWLVSGDTLLQAQYSTDHHRWDSNPVVLLLLFRHFKENIPIEKGANLLLPSDSLICWLSIKI